MKKTILLLFLLIIAQGQAQMETSVSATQWQEDLSYLQYQVHTNFPFLFKKVTQENWDRAVDQLHQEIPNMEPHEIKVGFSRIISLFKYGHTQIPFSTLGKAGILPLNLYHFKDGVFVEGTTKEHQKILGAKLIKIGEYPVAEALEHIYPVVPAENDSYFKAYGLRFLTIPAVLHAQNVIDTYADAVTMTFEKEGQQFTYSLPHIAYKDRSTDYLLTIPNQNWISARDTTETPLYLKKLNDTYFNFEYLEDSKTLYVRQSSVFNHETETIKDFYNRLFAFADEHEIEKFVYDVRLNGGGNNYNNKGLIQAILARPDLNKTGKFFYITGRQTFSACQNLTNEIENYTNAIIIGEPTAENKNFYGDTKKVTLPNSKLNCYLSFAWWQDMPQWENADATVPIVAIEPTFEEYQTNQDPVLAFILTQDMDGFMADPMAHLTQLFIENKIDQLRTDAAQIMSNPLYEHIPFDAHFMQAVENLAFQGQHQGVLLIYQLLSESYPEDVTVWENLGKAYEKLNQKELAQKAFKTAAQLRKE
ncbi:hypothetical protein [Flavobacterium sp. ASW18X]|uniref:hypothetical protein n=1 Tax=Flavobacterium sp. ASW18X TaxID=2572595 RepID=UPI0010AE35BC|nr:hypothetical protein [Flavobacterium sp. ASW18X]TKD66046.1 hypothetical protein FBT53_04030 [Flavobacterium sp. ASW18X]